VKVLVTGASGFLGSHIAEQLATAGHEVRALLRLTSSRRFLTHFPHTVTLGDITDPKSLPAAVEDVDAIVHAAALVKARNEAEFKAVNEKGTANLVEAVESTARRLQRFVYISSLAAHGPSDDGKPRPVHAPPRPVSAYGRTKLAGELLVQRSSFADRSVIFRMPVIYGPRDQALLPFFKLAKFRLAPLLMSGRNRISIVYVEDAASAVVQSLEAEAPVGGRIYSPDDGEVYSWRDLLFAVESAVAHRALRLNLPLWTFQAAALTSEAFGFLTRRAISLTRDKVQEMAQPHWVCSSEPLRSDLGWVPRVKMREGAVLTAEWYRANRWL
jgi:nucleoside-diphosphate-sugar epimerase